MEAAELELNWTEILKPCTLVRDRRNPVFARLAETFARLIKSGKLPSGTKLPADRELARLLSLDRSTVARAYEELRVSALVESGIGRGTFVTWRSQSDRDFADLNLVSAPRSSSLVWAEKFSRSSDTCANLVSRQPGMAYGRSDMVSFSAGIPSLEFFPQAEFEEILKEIANDRRARELFGYSPVEGHPLLREEIFKLLSSQGISAKESELLIVSGSQQGIDLVTRTFIDPGDAVLVEDPSYFWALCNFASFGAKCVPVASNFNGLELDILESLISRRRFKLLYTMPSFQNPTGATMPLSARKELLRLAETYQVPIFEDNFVGDLSYDLAPPPLRSFENGRDSVVYQSTLSKALCPGLRLGWVVGPSEVVSRLGLAKRTSDLSTNSVSQVVAAEYLRRGLYSRHLDLVKDAYRRRRDLMSQLLSEQMPDGVEWQTPLGGMFIWVKLTADLSAKELLPIAEREGVSFSPGDVFYVGGDHKESFRLSFIQSSEEEIELGIKRLSLALSAYMASKRSPSVPGFSSDLSERSSYI